MITVHQLDIDACAVVLVELVRTGQENTADVNVVDHYSNRFFKANGVLVANHKKRPAGQLDLYLEVSPALLEHLGAVGFEQGNIHLPVVRH